MVIFYNNQFLVKSGHQLPVDVLSVVTVLLSSVLRVHLTSPAFFLASHLFVCRKGRGEEFRKSALTRVVCLFVCLLLCLYSQVLVSRSQNPKNDKFFQDIACIHTVCGYKAENGAFVNSESRNSSHLQAGWTTNIGLSNQRSLQGLSEPWGTRQDLFDLSD